MPPTKTTSKVKRPPVPVIEKIGQVSSKSVEDFTGKNWDQWMMVLAEAGAIHWTHKEIADHLVKKHRLTEWWKHIVATGFEIQSGKKIEGRNERGEYATTATATMAVGREAMWKFLVSDRGLAIWLKPLDTVTVEPGNTYESEHGVFGEFRTMREGHRLRLTWQDPEWEKPTVLQIGLVDRPKQKCMLFFQHEKLKEARLKESLKTHWKAVIDELRKSLRKDIASELKSKPSGGSARKAKTPAPRAKKP